MKHVDEKEEVNTTLNTSCGRSDALNLFLSEMEQLD